MNAAYEVLAEVKQFGVTLRVCDGRLLARPISARPAEIAERAHQHRNEIIDLLARLSDCEAQQALDLLSTDSPRNKQREIDPEIVAELERIEGQALALGWSPERLWNANFWYPRPLTLSLRLSRTVNFATRPITRIGAYHRKLILLRALSVD
jgi:hypothetical protein